MEPTGSGPEDALLSSPSARLITTENVRFEGGKKKERKKKEREGRSVYIDGANPDWEITRRKYTRENGNIMVQMS